MSPRKTYKDTKIFEALFILTIASAIIAYFCMTQQLYFFLGIAIILYLAIIAFAIFYFKYFKKHKDKNNDRKQKQQFLTSSEKRFKKLLHQNLPKNIEIHCKVRLADILKWETHRQSIKMMHVDYLLVDENMQPIFVIELDDKSHDTPKQKERDARKDNALNESEIKYARISNRSPDDEKNHPAIMKNIVEFCKMKVSTISNT